MIAPLKTNITGPAPLLSSNEEDIVDEAIKYYRPNLLYKNYDLKGPADNTLIYLMVYIPFCV